MKTKELFVGTFNETCDHIDFKIAKLETQLRERESLINLVQFCVDNEDMESIKLMFDEDLETRYKAQFKLEHSSKYATYCAKNMANAMKGASNG